MSTTWDEVWERRTPAAAPTSELAKLIALDGLDTGFGSVAEEDWVAGVRETARRIGLRPGDSVFEVGCGAGAFLYDLRRQGHVVAGLDRSATLIRHAREALPGASLTHADALDLELDLGEQYDAVISWGVFLYFPSHEYALRVLAAMAAKARRVVAVLDLPDAATRDAAMALRRQTAGGEEAYARRYAGLEHLYYDRARVTGALAGCGLSGVTADDQWISGYANARFRFNAWAFKPGA